MSPKTPTLPDVRPVAPEPPVPPAALDILEAVGRESADAAARALEVFRARLRTAHQEVPSVLTQIRALEKLYMPELRRLAGLPWPEFRARLGSETLVGSLRGQVNDLLTVFTGRTHFEFSVASVADQLARLAPLIERLGVDDVTRADEVVAECRRAPEWPAVIVKSMSAIRDAYGRLVEALRRRGTAADAFAPGAGIVVTTPTGDPAPAPASPDRQAVTAFNPLTS